jgi:hypothetical protein
MKNIKNEMYAQKIMNGKKNSNGDGKILAKHGGDEV